MGTMRKLSCGTIGLLGLLWCLNIAASVESAGPSSFVCCCCAKGKGCGDCPPRGGCSSKTCNGDCPNQKTLRGDCCTDVASSNQCPNAPHAPGNNAAVQLGESTGKASAGPETSLSLARGLRK